MATNIVPLHLRSNHHHTDLLRAECALRTLAAALTADQAAGWTFDESEVFDALHDVATRVASAADAAARAGHAAASLLRVEGAIRIAATALFAEVDDNPARDAATLRDALVDLADRLASIANEFERVELAARSVA